MIASEREFRYRFWFISTIFAAAFACYWIDPNSLARRSGHPTLVRWAAAALAALGAAVRTWASAYLHSDVVHDSELHTDRLVADGPYRHLRNPLYLGVLLLGGAQSLLTPPSGTLVIWVGLTVFALRLIGREEAELTRTQGESYRAFLQAVPRLLPSLRARLPASGARPRWGQAVTGELFMWGFAAALAVLAVTRSLRLYGLTVAGSFALFALLGRAKKPD